MADITISLSDANCMDYAIFHGWSAEIVEYETNEDGTQTSRTVSNPLSCDDFMAQIISQQVQTDIIAKRNADALAAVATQPAPQVTTN